jgi:hypothetical protein
VLVASAGLAYGGSAAFATRTVHFRLRPLAAVFSVLRHARSAGVGPGLREPIAGASSTVFAQTFSTGDSVYVVTLPSGDVCLADQEPAGAAGAAPNDSTGGMLVACAHPAEAEQTGLSILTPSQAGDASRITVLVPNGVGAVVFDTTGGATVTQTPVDNVAQYSAQNLTAANFVAPGGQRVSDAVPAIPGSASG